MNEITKEDLDWLYYGSIENGVIAKLTNEICLFEIYVNSIVTKSNLTINNVLNNIINGHEQRLYSIIIKNINKNQLNRLYKLNEKYKFKSYNDDTQFIKNLIKEKYYDSDFLISQDFDDVFNEIQKILNDYKLIREKKEIKDMIRYIYIIV